MTLTMSVESPDSGKYVVYTVTSDESSTDLEDGHVNFKDTETDSLNGKQSPSHRPLRSLSSDSSKWSSFWSTREKCCCLWNIAFIMAIGALVFVVVYLTKRGANKPSFETNYTRNPMGTYYVSTMSPKDFESESNQICYTSECVRLSAELRSRMNTSADPCEDFYEYACGGYTAPLTWTAPRVREVPDALRHSFTSLIIEKLSSAIRSHDTPGMKVAKKAYQSCVTAPDRNLQQHFEELVDSFEGDPENPNEGHRHSLTRLLAHAVKFYGVSPLFKVIRLENDKLAIINRYSDQRITELSKAGHKVSSFRHLSVREFYYLTPSDKKVVAYRNYVRNILKHVFGNGTSSFSVAYLKLTLNEVLDFEMRLNQAMFAPSAVSSLNIMLNCTQRYTIGELERSSSGYKIDWRLFFSILLNRNVTENFAICFSDISYDVTDILYDTQINVIKNFIKLHIILNSDIAFANHILVNPFIDNDINSLKFSTKEIKCFKCIENILPVSSIFKSTDEILFMRNSSFVFGELKKSLIKIIDNMYWIPFKQRKAFISHANEAAILFTTDRKYKIYDSSAYFSFLNKSDFYPIVFRAIRQKYSYEMDGYIIAPLFTSTISYYDDLRQTIVLSPMANKEPIFYHFASNALLFGSTGAFIAQILARVFDIDVILSYYLNGIIEQEVVFTFAHHFQCLVETFTKYTITDLGGKVHQANGALTKGENFRDTLALRVTYNSFKSNISWKDKYMLPALQLTENQLFFVAYTQTLCERVNPRGVEMFYINNKRTITLPRHLRIKGVLSNFDHFSKDFNCPVGSAMNPVDKCVLF
ncbi:neprilysin-2-like [Saccostrea echinata]|uniref:neprilysin-2-like n=1 Tax=Saccostrea echinata TaxID=191078 RepID=UPI002A82998B|nr:neprilysin-2-like [Saccostrea echinata]